MAWTDSLPWNYLRVRGEYKPYQYGGTGNPELPPRARRILIMNHTLILPIGTTSACAENTGTATAIPAGWGNYLRVRGEYYPTMISGQIPTELPPRARRIP